MIAREGYVPLVSVGAIAIWVAVSAAPGWSLPLWVVFAVLAVVYRAPIAELPKEPLALLSPVRGRVAMVDETRDPWLERSVRRVRVALSFPGVGIVLSPTEGKIMDYWTSDRPFSAAREAAPSTRSPNCYGVWVRTDEGDDVVIAISSLRPISRFKLDFAPGERVGQGRRNGFVYFASFVDVLVPLASRVEVEPDARVVAGATVLARLVHD